MIKKHRKSRPLTAIQLKKFLDGIVVPEGFVKTTKDIPADRWMVAHQVVELSKNEPGDKITIKMIVHSTEYEIASGHTTFSSSKGERCFDRLGVEDSFYIHRSDKIKDANVKILEQLEKIKTSRERLNLSESIPGIPFMVTPDTKAVITAKLLEGKSHTFMPSGFGTGYVLYSRGPRRSHVKRCDPATESFFGIIPLYFGTMDCD